jgi:membrane-bound metal-dependent hydrolase YbcI (DUF457 family)
MALLPDWRLPYHRDLFSYRIHHSLLVNALAVGLIGAAMGLSGGIRRPGGRLVLLGMAVAVASHLVLDSFYSHGKGVPIGWPFGDFSLVMPLPWLHVQQRPMSLDWTGVRIRLVEVLTFGPLVLAAILGRRLLSRRALQQNDGSE